ncbi:MAG: transporter substrate-binding domain-containing protein [Campylobacter sp.]|nr:transporter substrate-binding domain-containing protein [Campylobacter sp.]
MKKILLFIFILFSGLFANTLEEIKAEKAIRIGVWANQPHFSVLSGDTYEGFEVDIAKELANLIIGDGAKIVFVGIDDPNDRINFLENNTVDMVIAAFASTDERKERVDFANPYSAVSQGILVDINSTIQNFAGLKGKSVAALNETYGVEFLKTKPEINLIVCDTPDECYDMLKSGAVDAYIDDNLISAAYALDNDGFVMPIELVNLGKRDYLAPAVAKGNDALKQEIDKNILELNKNGFFKKIYENNFGSLGISPSNFLLEDFYNLFAIVD